MLHVLYHPVKVKWLVLPGRGLAAVRRSLLLLAGAASAHCCRVAILKSTWIFSATIPLRPLRVSGGQRVQHRYSRQTIHFKKAAKEAQQKTGYLHKCCVCGTAPTTPTWSSVLLQVRRLPLLLYGPTSTTTSMTEGVGQGSAPDPGKGAARHPPAFEKAGPKLFAHAFNAEGGSADYHRRRGLREESFRSSLLANRLQTINGGFQGQSPWAPPGVRNS